MHVLSIIVQIDNFGNHMMEYYLVGFSKFFFSRKSEGVIVIKKMCCREGGGLFTSTVSLPGWCLSSLFSDASLTCTIFVHFLNNMLYFTMQMF